MTKEKPVAAPELPEKCVYPEAHAGHMALNGECPWCGESDPEAIHPNASPEDFG